MVEFSQIRLFVITNSILVEYHISTILCSLLGIDQEISKTLGNKTSSFSFHQKLDLLLDMKHLDKDSRSKLQKFAEIRNQFAHNPMANDFTSSMKVLDGAENFLKKNYGTTESHLLPEEEQIGKLYKLLVEDVFEILAKLNKIGIKKHTDYGLILAKLEVHQTLLNNIGAEIREKGELEAINSYNTEVAEASVFLKNVAKDFDTEVNFDEFLIQ